LHDVNPFFLRKQEKSDDVRLAVVRALFINVFKNKRIKIISDDGFVSHCDM
jgi:hypothetical protein